MTIAIIGTNGFLSTTIAKYALERGWQINVYGLDKPQQHSYTSFCSVDLTRDSIDALQLYQNDMVIYTVGAGIQSNLNEAADIIYMLNVMVPIRICKVLQSCSYKGIFVTFGSYFELGETYLRSPATELDVINAISSAPTDYVLSKRMLTRFISSYKHDFRHWHFILPTIYGPGENSQRLIPYVINAIIQKRALCFTNGEQVRQYLFVGDVPKVLECAYERSLASGIYNIAGNDIYTVREIVKMIHDYFGIQLRDECFGSAIRSDVGMKYLVLDGMKLDSVIGKRMVCKLNDTIKLYSNGFEK